MLRSGPAALLRPSTLTSTGVRVIGAVLLALGSTRASALTPPQDGNAVESDETAAGSTLGTSHQLWMANEINKLIWPSTSGIGHINEEQWDATVEMALATKNQDGAQVITTDPPDTAYTNEYVDEAIANLEADGVDVLGESYEPIEVTLNEGGN